MKDCSVVHVIQGVFYVQKEHDRETLCSALGCQETLQLTVPYTAVVVYYGLAIKVTMAPIHSWLRTVGRSPLRYALMAARSSSRKALAGAIFVEFSWMPVSTHTLLQRLCPGAGFQGIIINREAD